VRLLEADHALPSFGSHLQAARLPSLAAASIEVLQVNVGKLCNQTCRHCHVDAGPDRREIMTRETMGLVVDAARRGHIPTIDLTGGAPELNPNFRWLVEECTKLGIHVIDRCNLSVLMITGQADLADFLATHRVEVVASLPYFLQQETDAQRGAGVFDRSIEALRKLNTLGYGCDPEGPLLNLVYNPVGAYLPPSQEGIERDFRRELDRRFGIRFNHLYTITNMPISRFLTYLLSSGNYEAYMTRLVNAFNPEAVAGLMCRSMVSVSWDGRLFDCDFNQMLELPVNSGSPAHIRDFDPATLSRRAVVTGRHCFGCTAGAGSSCGGTTT
ncbi:MAG: arsenosugar biosynthesis radical SAM (seleno)protein ArsS, partial [Acidobacteriota bacterium]